MSSYDIESPRKTPGLVGLVGLVGLTSGLRSARSASVAAVSVALLPAIFLAGCTSSHPNATAPSSAPGSGLASSSGPATPLSSAPASASPAVSSAASSLPTPISSTVPGAAPVANIEAPATKSGFQIRLHRGSILKVDPQQAKAGSTIAFALVPAGSSLVAPISGFPGYFTGAADGVVNITVTQDGAAIGSLSVTVWG
jgi:hypothetical protein